MDKNSQLKRQPKRQNPFINLVFNILIPAMLLTKGHCWFGWNPTTTLLVALAFPLGYGVIDFIIEKKVNALSILGLVSIALTGAVGLFELSKEWIAFKEAAVPLIICIVILASLKTNYPLVKTLLYNDKILCLDKIETSLKAKDNERKAEKLLMKCSYMIAGSFLLSSVLNFTLAKILIKSETGTQAFTEELGKMTAWSYPVIALPCTIVMFIALWMLLHDLKKLTGIDVEDMLNNPMEQSADKA